MIEAVLIFNKFGIIRFIKLYNENERSVDKNDLVKRVLKSIYESKETNIIFDIDLKNQKQKLVFRRFGAVYLAMILDELENELAILDFINLFMQILDEIFKGVSELHMIMNPEKIYLIIDEMISGGMVIETNKAEILSNYEDKMKDDANYNFFAK